MQILLIHSNIGVRRERRLCWNCSKGSIRGNFHQSISCQIRSEIGWVGVLLSALNSSNAEFIDVGDFEDIPYSQQYLVATPTKVGRINEPLRRHIHKRQCAYGLCVGNGVAS